MQKTTAALAVVEKSNAINEAIELGYVDDLFGITVPAHARTKSNFPVRTNLPAAAQRYVPIKDKHYSFDKEHIRVLQHWFWALDGATNILLTGETGTGKTSLLQQAASRLHWPVIRVGCHSALEFQELVGHMTLNADGSAGWVDGPLILAARYGAILLLDEMNFLSPGTSGGLNTALDDGLDSHLSGLDLLEAMTNLGAELHSRGGYYVPETGEIVRAHPGFRIGATGNAIDGSSKGKYRGVVTSNIALLERFTLGIKIEYMTTEMEQAMLHNRYPSICPHILLALCSAADGVRKCYARGEVGSVLSTRVLKAMIGRIAQTSSDQKVQLNSIGRFLNMSLLYRVDEVDAKAIRSAVEDQIKLTLGLKEFKVSP